MKPKTIMIAGNGSACVCAHQAAIVKENQRIFWNSGDASMGYDLPAAIGASYEADNRNVICLTGDGSVMMNIQELQTIVYNKLPIKIFINATTKTATKAKNRYVPIRVKSTLVVYPIIAITAKIIAATKKMIIIESIA